MGRNSDLDAVAEAIIAAHGLIEEHGTQEMKTLSRMLLFMAGQQIAQRSNVGRIGHDGALMGTDRSHGSSGEKS